MVLAEVISHQVLRIIDANLNRLGEGLRVLEEIARLLLDDTTLTEQLKTIRHDLIRVDYLFYRQLLQSRNSENDVGVDIEVLGEEKERELPLVLAANARRVQKSLRTLEELAKAPDINRNLDSERFKQARFRFYTIERELLSRLLCQDKLKLLSGPYVIVDLQALGGRDPLEVTRQVIDGGARTMQLRDKAQSKDKLLPLGKILGCSTTTVEQAVTAQSEGADYIAVGAFYPTSSKTLTRVPAQVIGPGYRPGNSVSGKTSRNVATGGYRRYY